MLFDSNWLVFLVRIITSLVLLRTKKKGNTCLFKFFYWKDKFFSMVGLHLKAEVINIFSRSMLTKE